MSSSIPSYLNGRFIMHKFTIASVMPVLLTAGVVFCFAAYGDQSEELIDAARKDDSNQVQPIPDKGADVNKRGKDGTTPLMWAAGEGSPKAVAALLDKGAEVDAKDNKDTHTAYVCFV